MMQRYLDLNVSGGGGKVQGSESKVSSAELPKKTDEKSTKPAPQSVSQSDSGESSKKKTDYLSVLKEVTASRSDAQALVKSAKGYCPSCDEAQKLSRGGGYSKIVAQANKVVDQAAVRTPPPGQEKTAAPKIPPQVSVASPSSKSSMRLSSVIAAKTTSSSNSTGGAARFAASPRLFIPPAGGKSGFSSGLTSAGLGRTNSPFAQAVVSKTVPGKTVPGKTISPTIASSSADNVKATINGSNFSRTPVLTAQSKTPLVHPESKQPADSHSASLANAQIKSQPVSPIGLNTPVHLEALDHSLEEGHASVLLGHVQGIVPSVIVNASQVQTPSLFQKLVVWAQKVFPNAYIASEAGPISVTKHATEISSAKGSRLNLKEGREPNRVLNVKLSFEIVKSIGGAFRNQAVSFLKKAGGTLLKEIGVAKNGANQLASLVKSFKMNLMKWFSQLKKTNGSSDSEVARMQAGMLRKFWKKIREKIKNKKSQTLESDEEMVVITSVVPDSGV